VLAPLLLRETLPHFVIAASPPLRLVDWAQRRLPLEGAARAAAGAARGWVALLELLLAQPSITALAPTLAAAGIDRVFGERLVNPPGKIHRAVIGAIDAASALEVRGWALDLCDKSVPVALEFYADNFFVGAVTCGESRPDVKEAIGGDGRCGFTFRIPTARRASLAGGRALIAVDALSRARVGISTPVAADVTQGLDVLGATRTELKQLREILERLEARLPDLGRLSSVPVEAYGEYWERFYAPAPDVLAAQRAAAAGFALRPLISVILPTWQSDPVWLAQAIDSVRAQSYERWELIITDDASAPDDARRRLIARYASDPRIRCLEHAERAGIAGNTNRGLAVAGGEYVAFLDHDDELAPAALYEAVRALQERSYAMLYSDEDRIEADGLGRVVHHTPFFKPGFDPDLLLGMNYLCHLVVVRRDVLGAVGGLRPGFDGAQDHELLLRVTEAIDATQVRHIPRILYHWRKLPDSASGTAAHAPVIEERILAAVQAHLDRGSTGARAQAHADPFGAARAFATRVRWPLPPVAPPVTVIIPTRDRLDLLKPCIESLVRTMSEYPGTLELLIVDNDGTEPATHAYLEHLESTKTARTVAFHGEFNWSAINNAAAREARGEVLIFLNNDTVVLSPDWCATLTAQALRPGVGAAGARLLYDDGTLQHAGVVLGVEGVAGHDSVGEAPERGGYFGRSHLQRSAAAVTGACLATRRELFERLGGFDELTLKVAFNDVDYCLRLLEAGYRVVYEPFAVLYHFESKSRGYDLAGAQLARQRAEAAVFRRRWSAIVDTDPFYNAHFERHARPFDRLRPP
jgi:GT2 family glycosyltransferase